MLKKNKQITEDINDTLAIKKGFAKPSSEQSMKSYDSFLANSEVDRLQKILTKYELFKMIMEIPGDIVECGVHSGSGVYLYSKLLQIFKPHSIQRVIGFDFFGQKKKHSSKYKIDNDTIDEHLDSSVFGSDPKTILQNLKKVGLENVDLIAGDVKISTKNYVKNNLGFRISMLILDVDNYEGTLHALKNLYPLVTKGGIIVLDEYALRTYGESNAVDEYFSNQNIKIKTISWAITPSAYIIKE